MYAIQLSSTDSVQLIHYPRTLNCYIVHTIQLLSQNTALLVAYSRLCIVEKFDCSVPHNYRLKILVSHYQRNYAIAI